MLTAFKSEGAASAANEKRTTGKGRVEFYALKAKDGTFTMCFRDVGNYGAQRWWGEVRQLTSDDLENMIIDLQDLVNGNIENTHESVRAAGDFERDSSYDESATPIDEEEFDEFDEFEA